MKMERKANNKRHMLCFHRGMEKRVAQAAIVLLLVSLFVLPLAVSGCGRGAVTPTPAPAPAPEKSIELKFAGISSPKHHSVPCIEAFKREVEEKTNGRIKIKLYLGQTLCKAKEMLEAVRSDQADIAWPICPEWYPGHAPLSTVAGLPMLATSSASATAGLQALAGEYLNKEWKGDFKVIALSTTEPYTIFTAKKPVHVPQDLVGMKIRGGGGFIPALKACGATPVSMSGPEIYEAQMRGVIDGCVYTPVGGIGFKLGEVTKYITQVPFGCVTLIGGMNWDRWNMLSKKDQEIIYEASQHHLVDDMVKSYDTKSKSAFDQYRKMGVKVITLTPAEKAKWEKALAQAWESWIKDKESKGLPGREVFNKFREAVTKYNK